MSQLISLSQLTPGERAEVQSLDLEGAMRRRMLDLGLIEHTCVECLGASPGGDPEAFLIRGAVIAIRKKDGSHILVHKAGGEVRDETRCQPDA